MVTSLLIALLVLVIVAAIIWMLPIPHNFRIIAICILALIAVIYLLKGGGL